MKEKVIREHLQECQNLMERVFMSGFRTANETVTQEMQQLSDISKQYGMEEFAKWQQAFATGVQGLRHKERSEQEEAELLRLFCQITRYLELALNKCKWDALNFALED